MTEPSRAAPSSSAPQSSWQRYWIALTVATVTIVAAARWCGQEFRSHYRYVITTGQIGSTIVYVHNGTLATWDWKTNERHQIRSASALGQQGVISQDGSKVAIVANGQQSMLICDLQPPHASRTVSLSGRDPTYYGTPLGFVGEGRYVVFWTIHDTRGPTPGSQTDVRVVDVKTGEIKGEYSSPTYTGFELVDFADTFESHTYDSDPTKRDEVQTARWRVSSEGKLVQIEEAKTGDLSTYRYGILQDDGKLKLQRSGTPLPFPQSRIFNAYQLCTTPQCAIWFVNEVNGALQRIGPRAILDEATGQMTPLDSVVIYDDPRAVQISPLTFHAIPKQNALLLIDRYGDLQVFDLKTGKTLGVDAPARTQRVRFFGLSLCLALSAALWLVVADRTPSLDWFRLALTISAVLAQVSLITSAFTIPVPSPYELRFHPWQIMAASAAGGIAASCLISIAWYWAWGDGLQPIRWCKGLVAWIAILMPANFVISRWYESFPPSLQIVKTAGFCMVMISYGIIGAGALALVLASPRLIGFRFGPRSGAPPESTRYQVGDLVVTMSGIAIMLAMVQLRVLEFGVPGNQWVFFGSRASMVAAATGIALVMVSLSSTVLIAQLPRVGIIIVMMAATAIIAMLVVTETFDLLEAGAWTLGDTTPYWGNATFLAAAWITSVLPLWLLHRKGWRWARCLQPQSDPAAAPAA